MKKIILVVFISLATLTGLAQDISGQWKGTLNVQGFKLKLIFNITEKEGGYTTTLDSPDQKAYGIVCNITSFADSNVAIDIASINAQYKGTLKGDTIKGIFTQRGMAFPLNIARGISANATEYVITGKVVDNTGQTIAYPTVSIRRDSTDTEYSERHSGNTDGTFEVKTKASSGKLWLNISAQTKTSVDRTLTLGNEAKIALGNVILADSQELEAVSVVAYKPLVTQDIDRINYDVEADPDSKTNSAMDMLRKVPLVTVDHEDNVKVKGSSNYNIYINGKPSNMVTKSPKDVLKSMPALSIKKIEVITDPGAKYDAEGVSAILNIVTHKALQGYQGNIRTNADNTGDWGLGGYFSTKVGKLGITTNYNYYSFQTPVWWRRQLNNQTTTAPYKSSVYDTETTYNGGYHYGSLEVSYEFDSLNLLSGSFGVRGGQHLENIISGNTYFITHTNDIVSAYSSTGSNSSKKDYNFSGNIDYQRSFRKPDQLLTFSYNFDLSPITSNTISLIKLDPRYPNTLGTEERNSRYISIGNSDEHSFQIDYTEPFDNKKHTIEGGLKYILRYNASDNSYYRYNPASSSYDLPELDNSGNPRQENDIYYYQHIFGAYASYMLRFNKFALRLGSRFEGTLQNVNFENSKQNNFSVKFFDVVPSVSFSYQPSYVSNFKFSYNNSISRPSISYLNPYIDDSNPYIIEYGNPNLNSERNHNFTLTYSFFSQKFNMNISANAGIKNNSIESNVFVDIKGVVHRTYANIGSNKNAGTQFFVNYNPLMWLSIWGQGTLNYNHYQNDNYNAEGVSFMGFGGINTTIPWKLRLTLGGGGSTPDVQYKGQSVSWYYYYAALSRSFLKNDRLTISLTAVNPFHKYNYFNFRVWEDNVYDNRTIVRQQIQKFGISISWRFGEMKSEIKKAERGITNDDLKKGEDKSGGNVGQGGI